MKKLYVGNLPYSTTEAELNTLFGEFGTVSSAVVISDRSTGQSKGFGFVEMANDEEAAKAMSALNGKDNGGRAMVVNEARPMEDRGNRGFGGGGGSRGGSDFRSRRY